MNGKLKLTTVSAGSLANPTPVQPVDNSLRRNVRRRYLRMAGLLVLVPMIFFVLFTVATNILWRGVAEGQMAPEFTAQDLDGNVVELSNFRGQPVMLTFWSPDCFACREELPALQAIAADSASEVALLTVVSYMPAAEVETFVAAQDLTFPVIVDELGEIPSSYQVSGIPFTYFIGPDGRVERSVIGAGAPGELQTDLRGWLNTCQIDAACTVE
jgi:peroxiredoxin